MSNFSGFERRLASILSGNPKLKRLLKNSYQRLMFFIHRPDYQYQSSLKLSKVSCFNDNCSTFFGYYDNNPFNGKYTLLQRTSFDTASDPGSIDISSGFYYVSVVDQNKNVIFECQSNAFNWQQGSKIQWLSEDEFIYNDIISNKIVAKIVNLSKNDTKLINLPVYDSCENFYLSLDYKPLIKLRPDYAYFSKELEQVFDYSKQSIHRVYFNGDSQVLFDITFLNNNFPLKNNSSFEKQKFNHIMISPDNSKFVFLHRYYLDSGQRIDRFFVSGVYGELSSLKLISDSGMISHYCWVDSSSLIAYMTHNGINGYFKISLSNSITIEPIHVDGLNSFGDGHPTYIGNNKFITDTYPNKSRMKKLLLVDIDNNHVQILGEFLEPLSFREQCRCDLHPRWSQSENSIYIDSTHSGQRHLYKVGPLDE